MKILFRQIKLYSLVILLLPAVAIAQVEMEMVALKHRMASDLIQVLKPMIPTPGGISGMSNNLIIRTDPQNMQAIKNIINDLDKPPKRLMISVRQNQNINNDQYGNAVNARLGNKHFSVSTGNHSSYQRNNSLYYRHYDTDSRGQNNQLHQIQTLEGREAFISTGSSVPYGSRNLILQPDGSAVINDSIDYKDVTSGFYALPYINGDTVTLHIKPRSEQLDERGNGRVNISRADTILSGKLGQWFSLGGVTESSSHQGTGTSYSTKSYLDNNRSIQIKVELLP